MRLFYQYCFSYDSRCQKVHLRRIDKMKQFICTASFVCVRAHVCVCVSVHHHHHQQQQYIMYYKLDPDDSIDRKFAIKPQLKDSSVESS